MPLVAALVGLAALRRFSVFWVSRGRALFIIYLVSHAVELYMQSIDYTKLASIQHV